MKMVLERLRRGIYIQIHWRQLQNYRKLLFVIPRLIRKSVNSIAS